MAEQFDLEHLRMLSKDKDKQGFGPYSGHYGCNCGSDLAEAADETERLRNALKTIDPLTFVVEDDHVILYAGTHLANARNVICGGNTISVWRSGTFLGYADFDGEWVFKTTDCNIPNLQENDG